VAVGEVTKLKTKTTMKKILILVLAGLFLIPAFAQKGKKDIVYLKSGGIIKGQIITNDLDHIRINSSGNQWVFKMAEVDSISKHSKVVSERSPAQDYFFDTSLGFLIGNSGNSQIAPFSFMTSFNYKVVDKLYVGAGLGAEFLDETYMPAFAQFRYKFRETSFTPIVNLQVGYQVPLEKESRTNFNNYNVDYTSYYQNNQKLQTEGGFLINPSIGFQQFTSDNIGWFFMVGYRYHQLNYSGDNGYKLETNISRLSLKIGFIFN
jgi:hypothetical protein